MDGIRVHDAALQVSDSSLSGFLSRQGGELELTRLDLSASSEALLELVGSGSPAAPAPPEARPSAVESLEIQPDGLRLRLKQGEQTVALRLGAPGVRIEFEVGGLRIRTEPAE